MKPREMQRTHQAVQLIQSRDGKDSESEDGMSFAGARMTKPTQKHFYVTSDDPI